jgi:hypothetical protein
MPRVRYSKPNEYKQLAIFGFFFFKVLFLAIYGFKRKNPFSYNLLVKKL